MISTENQEEDDGMLSTPQDGWSWFQLGQKESFRLSYLTDVANDWLSQAIHGLETMDVFSVHGFSEPGRMVCTVSYWSCYVIFEDDGPAPICEGVNHIHVSMMDFCKQLYADISNDLDAWVHWDDSALEDELDEGDDQGLEALVQERRIGIQSKLDQLKRLIEEKEEFFGEEGLFF